MTSPSPLETHLASYSSLLVGYSGGVDSALLAVAARRVLGRKRSVAALGVSASLSAAQHAQAVELAHRFDLQFVEIATDELADPDYAANAPSRCYFCKRELWDRLGEVAAARGMAAVADGTNADDLSEHRPGLRAARERGVVTPLVAVGYTKADVRREARALGIPIWNAPAAPCLSSRLRFGLRVTDARLRQVEAGEATLRALGVGGDLRVRHRGDEARIEVARDAIVLLRRHRRVIADKFRALGFARVTVALDGYRRGSQLSAVPPRLEVLGGRF